MAPRHRGRYAVGRGPRTRSVAKTREHVADISELAEMAKHHLKEGRFEDAAACLHLIEQHASIGREGLGPLLDR